MARKPKYGSPTVRLGAYVPEQTRNTINALVTEINQVRFNGARARQLSLSETLVVLIDHACQADSASRKEIAKVLLALP